jgi:acyl carrier protein
MDRILRALNAVTDTEVTDINPDAPLKELDGWDSMRAINFQMELEQEFGVDLSSEQITGNSTIGEVTGMLLSKGVGIG